jgi:tripartite-type tricarboxylate transporter receptor subunit TctC
MSGILMVTFAGLAAFAGTAAGQASPWPQRPVRFILGFPAGGASDIVARAVAQHLSERWGQQAVIDNRPGATGLIASELAAQASADGYNVLLISSSYANNVILKPKTSFDPLKDLVPVTKVAMVPNIAVIPPTLPVKNIGELVRLAKDKPGALSYASGGAGTGTSPPSCSR